MKLLLGILRHTDLNLHTLAGNQSPFLVSGQLEILGPRSNGNALVAVLTLRTKKIIPEMAHPMSQQVFKLHFRNIFKQILLEQGFPILKIPALK